MFGVSISIFCSLLFIPAFEDIERGDIVVFKSPYSFDEKLISSRNLRPKKKEGFLKIISAFSFIGIMLGVKKRT